MYKQEMLSAIRSHPGIPSATPVFNETEEDGEFVELSWILDAKKRIVSCVIKEDYTHVLVTDRIVEHLSTKICVIDSMECKTSGEKTMEVTQFIEKYLCA